MKPNFALNLSHEGICLLRRAKAGWVIVGEVQLDAPDLNERLSLLRQQAATLDSEQITCKLVIPNSQILYTEVDAPGPSDRARSKQIRAALEGLTPYQPKDLVFDWRAEGSSVQVAVVARETLREAEAFAAEFQFNPVSFVAMATPDSFDGEPYFGLTQRAPDYLGKSPRVERDATAIQIVPGPRPAPLPSAQKQPAEPAPAEAAPVQEVPSEPAAAADPARPDEADAQPEAPKPTKPKAKRKAKPKPATDTPPEPQSTIAPEIADAAPALAAASTAPEDPKSAGAPPVSFASRRAAAPPVVEPLPDPVPGPSAPPIASPIASPVVAPEPAPNVAAPTLSALDLDDVPEMPAWRQAAAAEPEPPVNGSSVPRDIPLIVDDALAEPVALPPRINGAATSTRVAKPAIATVAQSRLRSRKEAIAASSREAKSMAILGERDAPKVGGKPRYLGLTLTVLLLMAFGVAALWSSLFLDDPAPGTGTGAIAAINPVEPIVAEPIAPVEEAPVETPAPSSADSSAPNVGAAAPEVAGPSTLGSDPVSAPLARNDTLGRTIDGALSEALDGAPDAERALPVPEIAAPLTLPSEELATPPVASEGTVEVARLEEPAASLPATAPPPDRISEAAPSRAEAERRYAISGIWQLDPTPLQDPAATSQSDSLLVASVDPALTEAGPAALRGDGPDLRPVALLPPRPLRSSFDLDARGLVPATPEGNVSPDGTLVFLGRPPVVPGSRPGTVAPEPEPTPEPEPAVLAQPEQDVPTQEPLPDADPEPAVQVPEEVAPPPLTPEQEILREVRPQVRPSSFEETFNQAPDEEGFSKEELALIRPSLRPPSVQEEVASDEPPAVAEETPASALAIASSSAPRGRPGRVERRAAEVVAARREAEESAQSNAGPPVRVAAAVVPRAPSRASVAREATEKNVLNLNRVNLIGVYGSASDRRALVRLSSGRYVKVEVGDRVDGGRVAAIGSNELRYVKGGRNITLKLPRG